MSQNLNDLKDDIDALDHQLFGEYWIVGGVPNLEGIEGSYPDEFEGVHAIITSVSINAWDVPDDLEKHSSVIRQRDGKKFTVSKIMPEIEGKVEIRLSEA